jgi:fructokinase
MKTHPTHKVVCFGEVLWDILPGAALPGGAPMNVTYHLHKLGLQPALITKVGKDEEGAELVRIFKAHGVGTGYFQWDEAHETGKVYAQLQENNEVTYDIVKPSAWDYIEWSNDLEKLVADAPYFVFGSLAARSEVSKKTLYQLLERAATKVLDINLRAPHYTKQGVEELLYKADILKLNKAELELVSGWLGPYNNLKDRVAAIADAYQLQTVVITSGSEGAYLYKEGTGFHHPGFSVTVKDTIGSGDAFLAGLLAGFVENRSPAQALAFANAMGAFMATQPGGCPAYDIREVQLLSQTGNL